MRVSAIALLLIAFASLASAQATYDLPAAPDVEVLDKNWRKDVRNPALDDDPLRAARETAILDEFKKETIRTNQVRTELGRDPLPLPTQNSSGIVVAAKSVWYIYTTKLKNTGTKTISSVVWEYVFFDPAKKADVSRHRCISNGEIKPGKSKTLTGRTKSPQSRVVDASKPDPQEKPKETIVVHRIEFTDGTFWTRDEQQQ